MYESNKGETDKQTSEFEKLLNSLDSALARQDVIISDIKIRVNTMIEPQKSPVECDSEKELSAGGFVGDVHARISRILDHNKGLEEINDILLRVVG
jgi:hypothetical protein